MKAVLNLWFRVWESLTTLVVFPVLLESLFHFSHWVFVARKVPCSVHFRSHPVGRGVKKGIFGEE